MEKRFPEIAVVDAHNEAFYYWLRAKNNLDAGPALLAHIDAHPDITPFAPPRHTVGDLLENRPLGDRVYSNVYLSISNFISGAVHENIVSFSYWFNPREYKVIVFGGEGKGLETEIEKGAIVWKQTRAIPPFKGISVEEAMREITAHETPILLDIDLDAYHSLQNPSDDEVIAKAFEELGAPATRDDLDLAREYVIRSNADYVEEVVRALPKERVIAVTIAMSQRPSKWTPAERISEFLDLTNGILERADLKEPSKPFRFLRDLLRLPDLGNW